MNEVTNMIFASHKKGKGLVPGGTDSSGCVVIVTDTSHKPYSISYDYGSSCTGSDGKVRSGKVIIGYNSTDITQVNTAFTATFQNFTVDANVYDGAVGFTNIGPNGNSNLVLQFAGNFTYNQPGQTQPDTMHINYAYEWIAGESSSPAANWQFSITGGVTSSFTAGQTDSLVITTPLIRNAKNPGCNYLISGTEYTVKKTIQGLQYRYVDYGNPGGCSDQAAVTINGVTTIQGQTN